MQRYVKQPIETTDDGQQCSPYCYFLLREQGNAYLLARARPRAHKQEQAHAALSGTGGEER